MPTGPLRATHNALAPDRMTAEERLREIGEILAAGLLRLRAKKQEEMGTPRVPWTYPPTRASMAGKSERQRKAMTDGVLAQLAALPGKTTAELKQLWRELYDREPPSFNRDFLIKRLAYRIQELAYGGLSARAEAKLDRLIADEEARLNGKPVKRRGDRPIAGTRLIREWQGVEHTVTVLVDGYEYQGRPYRSLSADRPRDHRHPLERAVVFRTSEPFRAMKAPVRKIRCAIYTRVSTDERLDMAFNSPRCPARGGARLHREPEARGLAARRRPLR